MKKKIKAKQEEKEEIKAKGTRNEAEISPKPDGNAQRQRSPVLRIVTRAITSEI